jgi:hypothetical protein
VSAPPSPLLDLFKRGEVAREVRLLAAQGILAPRAHEQLGILITLLDDADPEIRTVANATLERIPEDALIGDRGVFPAEIPAIEADEPLIEVEDAAADALSSTEENAPEGVVQQLARMGFVQRLKAAFKGTREMRAILVRDPNKIISSAVMSSPKLSEQEVEGFSKMANIPEEVLRVIGSNRAWLKNYGIVVGLTKNPKTPVAMSLSLMSRLNAKDLGKLAIDRNVPEPLRVAARRRVGAGASGS